MIRFTTMYLLYATLVCGSANPLWAGYIVTDIFYSGSEITGFANSGLVTGTRPVPGGQGNAREPYIYDSGVYTYITPPALYASAPYATSTGINSSGQVVGMYRWSPPQGASRLDPFLYTGGVTTNVNSSEVAFVNVGAINDVGEFVGMVRVSGDSNFHSAVVSNGEIQILQNAQGIISSGAWGISNSGNVTGIASDNHSSQAFLYSDGAMRLLGTLGGGSAVGRAVNDSGQVVGESLTGAPNNRTHAFLFSDGVMHDLGSLSSYSSYATGINDAGVVVGRSVMEGGASTRGFVYKDGKMQDLSDLIPANLGLFITNAIGINDSGQIAATAWDGQLGVYGVILSPDGNPPSPIPEPRTITLIGIAAICVVCRAGRYSHCGYGRARDSIMKGLVQHVRRLRQNGEGCGGPEAGGIPS